MEFLSDDAADLLDILEPLLVEAPNEGLKFTNEMYVLRHQLTQLKYRSRRAAAALEVEESADDLFLQCRRLVAAAKLTLDAAEDILPTSAKTIDGERFWDRFARVAQEREAQVEIAARREMGR
jgi:hypothetical protein